ncbi:MAG TPA: glycosyltransferase family 4 protein [Phycisphaerae bacterium]|nr:glycosyltransferase family 4 protein [Phycisphaerae bacterium]
MKVFMLGWEFPPHISGGLGTACQGLTRALNQAGVEVVFALPTCVPYAPGCCVSLRTPASLEERRARRCAEGPPYPFSPGEARTTLRPVAAALQPYGTPHRFEQARGAQGPGDSLEGRCPTAADRPPVSCSGPGRPYEGDLLAQVRRYAELATEVAEGEEFDVVHAHDWMTYPAGLAVARQTGKPLAVHVHSTEFDRCGDHPDPRVCEIERAGMHAADRVLCVSYFTWRTVCQRYGVAPEKAVVVHNGVDAPGGEVLNSRPIARSEKVVLFLGRITLQKGPEYFLRAAKRVLEKLPDVRFVLAGSGDLFGRIVELSAALGIGRHVTFTGFLNGREVSRAFGIADLYVMPSVSEPFGIAPLEALAHNVPVIVSRQSGVSEVLRHALKVDFWDIDEMADKMVAVLTRPALHESLRRNGAMEVRKLTWSAAAQRCIDVYQALSAGAARWNGLLAAGSQGSLTAAAAG